MNALTRRRFLTGLGVTIPLPLFEATLAPRAAAAATPLRWGILYFPNGTYRRDWETTAAPGGRPVIPAFLQAPLEPIAGDLVWLNGIDNPRGGLENGSHETASGAFLTGASMRVPGPKFGKSADRIVAEHFGDTPGLHLALGGPGYQRAASCCRNVELALNHISWRNESTPATKLVDPRIALEQIVRVDPGEAGKREAARRQALRKSVLDYAGAQATRLKAALPPLDRERLDQYLDSLRDVEKRITAPAATASCQAPAAPAGTLSFEDHNAAMLDVMFVGFQCGVTRVASFLMDFEFSDRKLAVPGISSGHHGVSHHGNDMEKVRQFRLCQAFYADRFARLVKRMKEAKDADGRALLDNSVLMLAGGLGEGDAHDLRRLAIVLAGTAGGAIARGRVLTLQRRVADVHRTIMQLVGARGPAVEGFADNKGTIPELAALP